MYRFVLKMPDEMRKKLRNLAHKKESTMAEEVRKAIEEYLRKEKRE